MCYTSPSHFWGMFFCRGKGAKSDTVAEKHSPLQFLLTFGRYRAKSDKSIFTRLALVKTSLQI